MKIGTCVNYNSIERMEEKFRTLQDNGFDNCQLIAWYPKLWTPENAQYVNELCKKYNITITAFWCGWEGPVVWDFYDGQITLGLVPPEYRALRIQNLCDGADHAHLLGVTDVVSHMGFIPENPNDPNFAPFCAGIRQIAHHLKKNDQYLLFETGQETPVTMLRCFEQVGLDNLGVNLDTANVILYGRANPVDALDVFGKYVRGLHAKDGKYPVNGHDLGEETRIGEGKVDFNRLFERLYELGYDGYVTIEREIQGPDQLKDILASREYLNNIISRVYAGGK